MHRQQNIGGLRITLKPAECLVFLAICGKI